MKFDWEKYNTDKNIKGHGYDRCYDDLLGNIRYDCKKILEIGTRIESISLWKDYFPNAKIYGIDLINPSYYVGDGRFIFEQINQGNEEQLNEFINKHGGNFDVIIDDGPHSTREQMVSFNLLFKNIKSGGVYVVEDLHCTEYTGNTKEKCDQMRGGLNYSFLDKSLEFEKQIFKENEYLYNLEDIKNTMGNVVITKAERVRWKEIQQHPSEIVFIFKK